eukprot:scaffold11335_cov24-Attheya_sp.AAC.1
MVMGTLETAMDEGEGRGNVIVQSGVHKFAMNGVCFQWWFRRWAWCVAVAVARFSCCSFFSDSSTDLRETGTWSGGRGTAVCPGVWPPPDDPVATRDAH